MYSVGEYIVHPGQGVCKVEAVEKEPASVYKLMPVCGRNPMLISFPISNEDRLRPILSHDEAVSLIEHYPSMGVDEFTDKSNALEEEHFKSQIKRGTCRDSVRIVKTFISRIDEVKARNKKPPVVYERILKQARERSLSELAVALHTSEDEVVRRFEGSLGEAPSEN